MRIGAGTDGKINAIAHESWSGDLDGGQRRRHPTDALLYGRGQPHDPLKLAVLDLPEGNAMRAPGEAPGLMALENARTRRPSGWASIPWSSAS